MPWRRLILAFVLVALAGAFPTGALATPKEETEDQLLARIQNERNPVKKAKYEIRLGRIKLNQARAAYDQNNVELGAQLLIAYAERMKSSWQTLRASGRKASRQPQGFKELDIALREDTRVLEDLRHRVSYFERSPVDKAAKEAEDLRGEVLRAIFPAERPAGGKNFFFGQQR